MLDDTKETNDTKETEETKALESAEKGKRKRRQEKPKGSPESYFPEANKHYYDDKNYEMAAEEFEKSTNSEDEYVAIRSLYWLGESYTKLKNYDKAIETFERLVNDNKFEKHLLSESAKRRIEAIKAIKAIQRPEEEG